MKQQAIKILRKKLTIKISSSIPISPTTLFGDSCKDVTDETSGFYFIQTNKKQLTWGWNKDDRFYNIINHNRISQINTNIYSGNRIKFYIDNWVIAVVFSDSTYSLNLFFHLL